MKTLGALMIFSATVATPALAQETGKRGTGSPYGSASQSNPRGAYNQVNGPSYMRLRDRFSPENFGNAEKDPTITGGEDMTLRAPSS
jgi:hypothetical protein